MRTKQLFIVFWGILFVFFAFNRQILQAQNMQESEKMEEPLSITKHLINDFSENWFELSKEIIFLNEKLNQHHLNLEIFNEAHRRGYFYLIIPRMPKYKPYLNLPGFDSISVRDIKLLRAANKASKTLYEVKLPASYKSSEKYPILFVFHGGGVNINNAKSYWDFKLLNKNYIRVFLQSYRHFDSKTYGWGVEDERLDADIRRIFEEVKSSYLLDENDIQFCGISAGANAAIDLALRSVIPVKNVYAICTNIPSILKDKKVDNILNKELGLFMLSGENDHFLERQRNMLPFLDELKINYKHVIIKNMGHEYPQDKKACFKRFLKFVEK